MTSLIADPTERGIMIVDDDESISMILKEFVEGLGYKNVYSVLDPMEAISILASHPREIYVILLDKVMPGMDGLTLIKHLTTVHSFHVGILLHTAYSTTVDEFYGIGNDTILTIDCITKPASVQRLEQEIKGALETVHRKRMGHVDMSAAEIHTRFDNLDSKLLAVDHLPVIRDPLSANMRETLTPPEFNVEGGVRK